MLSLFSPYCYELFVVKHYYLLFNLFVIIVAEWNSFLRREFVSFLFVVYRFKLCYSTLFQRRKSILRLIFCIVHHNGAYQSIQHIADSFCSFTFSLHTIYFYVLTAMSTCLLLKRLWNTPIILWLPHRLFKNA